MCGDVPEGNRLLNMLVYVLENLFDNLGCLSACVTRLYQMQ